MTLTVLLSWIYLFPLTLGFVIQWLSFHWKILSMLLSQFPLIFLSDLQFDVPFYHIAYDYSRTDWDGFCDYLTDV